MSVRVNRLGGGTVRIYRGVGVLNVIPTEGAEPIPLELHSLTAALELVGFAVIDMEATE